jgi:hypothetical protein
MLTKAPIYLYVWMDGRKTIHHMFVNVPTLAYAAEGTRIDECTYTVLERRFKSQLFSCYVLPKSCGSGDTASLSS